MNLVYSVIGKAISDIIIIVEVLLFIRALLSWIPQANVSKLGEIVYSLTEPILIPFRRLVANSSVVRNSFIDIAFIVALLVLEIVRRLILNIFL